MMWERFQEKVESYGSPILMQTQVTRIEHDKNRIKGITALQADKTIQITGADFISTMPVTTLLRRLDPQPPEHVLMAARGLKYRDFLIVSLVIDDKDLFPDNWIYIHSPEFKVGRIQNFKNWSPAMVPDVNKTCLKI